MDKKAREESRSGKREVEREEEKTVVVERRCVNPFSIDVSEEVSPMDDLGRFGESWDDFYRDSCACGVVGCACCDCCVYFSFLGEVVSPSVSDCVIVKSKSFSFSRKRRAFHMESQGDRNTASTAEDVQP